ncbi:MAG: asparaginase [Alphaproteobacteria bacterium]|nr:MAG: asparaginase [Alphaproteobacteria bacterium]
MVESRHRVAIAVVDAGGHVVLARGDVERPIYPRSAIKPLQALPLIETGAAAAFTLDDRALALACASHNGEPRHTEVVEAWLRRIGCTVADLECGVHPPYHRPTAEALIRAGQAPSALHNNCSGKHAGFLTVARHLDVPTRGYIRFEHPVQQRVLGVLEAMTGLDLGAAPRGIDGCGIPVIGIPLGNLALAMARFADPHDQPQVRQDACTRLRAAMTGEPFMVAGSGRFCTRAIEAADARAVVKTGAEGVFCAAIPDSGLGIALKVEDGATRAAEVAMAAALIRFGVPGIEAAGLHRTPLHNRAGTRVGEVRIAGGAAGL